MFKLFAKCIILMFLLVSVISKAQIAGEDTTHIAYKDQSGRQKTALVVHPSQILIIDGDSIYSVQHEFQLRKILEKKTGVINIQTHPDSVALFLRSRFKAIIIIKKN